VVRRCVRSRNLVKEEALAHWGLSRQKQTNCLSVCLSVLMTEYGQLKMEAGGSSERLVHMDNTTTRYAKLSSNTSQCIELLTGKNSKCMRFISNIGQLAVSSYRVKTVI